MAKADIATILSRLLQRDLRGYQGVVDLAREQPARIGELIRASITSLPRSSTAIDAAFGLVADDELQEIADASVGALREGMDRIDSQAASLVARLSLQAPDTLRRHLPELWTLRPNDETYYAQWPWRGATTEADTSWLARRFADESEHRERAFACLLESRTPHGIAAACECVGRGINDDERTAAQFLSIGLMRNGARLTRLFRDPTHHIVFPPGFLRLPQWIDVEGTLVDPTWRSEAPVVGKGHFGGNVEGPCAICEQPLHRLLSLSSTGIPPAFVRMDHVDLVTCLSCLGWSEPTLFFDHRGVVRPLARGLAKRAPEFPARAFPETDITFVVTPSRWRHQDWGSSNSRESLHRIGGEPTWIQNAEYPQCPECRSTMCFVAQLDSFDFGETQEWLWGSGGIVYIFWCATCLVSGTLWQCT